MKYKFCGIRINVTKITSNLPQTEVLTRNPRGYPSMSSFLHKFYGDLQQYVV